MIFSTGSIDVVDRGTSPGAIWTFWKSWPPIPGCGGCGSGAQLQAPAFDQSTMREIEQNELDAPLAKKLWSRGDDESEDGHVVAFTVAPGGTYQMPDDYPQSNLTETLADLYEWTHWDDRLGRSATDSYADNTNRSRVRLHGCSEAGGVLDGPNEAFDPKTHQYLEGNQLDHPFNHEPAPPPSRQYVSIPDKAQHVDKAAGCSGAKQMANDVRTKDGSFDARRKADDRVWDLCNRPADSTR
jgi:hypothetical protein